MKALAVSIPRRSLALALVETLLIVLAVAAGTWVRLGTGAWPVLLHSAGITKALLIAVVCQVCFYYKDLYHFRVVADRRELLIGVFQALGASSFVLAGIYVLSPVLIIDRGVFVASVALVGAAVAGWRITFEWVTRRIAPRERLLLVGTGPAAVNLARELMERRQELGMDIVGFIDPERTWLGTALQIPSVIGTIEDIPAIVRMRHVDRVVVSLADARGKLPMDKLLEMRLEGVHFDHLASVYEKLTGKIAIENLRPSWLIFSAGFRKSRIVRATKRGLDVIAGAVGLVLLAPVMLLLAAAIRLTSPGPALYCQLRIGQHGRVFTVRKLRSMRQDAEAASGPVWARQNDDRITPLGRFLRRTRLDELPQLWNVLVGEMSLIGPRPERPEFVQKLTNQIPFYGQRHVVRPGLSGWAQIRYTYGSSVEDAMEKLQYDLFYIKNLSLPLDLFIILSTIKTVLLRRGA